MHVHVLFLVLTVEIFLTRQQIARETNRGFFRSTNCPSPRFMQQVHRVLFGHPIFCRLAIVISSGRVFSAPSSAFSCESLCVCSFFLLLLSITSPVSIISFSICFWHSSERFPPCSQPGQRAVLPTFSRTFLFGFFRCDFISVHSSLDRDTTNDSLALPRTAPFGFHGSPVQILRDARSHDISPASRFTTRRLFIAVGVRNEILSVCWYIPTNTALIHRSFTMTSSASSSLNRHTSQIAPRAGTLFVCRSGVRNRSGIQEQCRTTQAFFLWPAQTSVS